MIGSLKASYLKSQGFRPVIGGVHESHGQIDLFEGDGLHP
jgi:hypothetical protein